MNKTRIKNIFRSITSSLNRFLSILFIVAIGTGFMAGLAATSPDMLDTADKYMDEYNLYDLDIKATLGFDEDDVEEISQSEEIEQVQAVKSLDFVLTNDTKKTFTSRVMGLLNDENKTTLNNFILKEGRLPSNNNECLLQATSGKYVGNTPKIGSTLSLFEDDVNYLDIKSKVNTTTLTVVGYVESPLSISVEAESSNVGTGSVELNVYVRESFYNFTYYTDLFLKIKDASNMQTFSTAYKEKIDSTKNILKDISIEQKQNRIDKIQKEYEEKILASKDSLKEIFNKTNEVNISFEENQANILKNNIQIIKILLESDDEDLIKLTDYLKKASFSKVPTLSTNEIDTIASNALEEVKKTISNTWLIRTRSDMTGFSSYESNVEKISALSKVFPIFFFLVALLVALTTMTRLVEENRMQIGTLKAIGYSNYSILSEYIIYSLLASVLGSILGLIVGFNLFPRAIAKAYSMMYYLPKTITTFRINIALVVAPITIVSIIIATFISCYKNFKALPSSLMVPPVPNGGKRIWLEKINFLWKHFSFKQKILWRNLFRYKKRLFMTIIGVAGCSALLVTGFGVKDSVNDIVDKQFYDINKYDILLLADSKDILSTDKQTSAIMNDKSIIKDYNYLTMEEGKVIKEKNSQVNIFVLDDCLAIDKYINLKERITSKKLNLEDDGVILTEKLCEELGVKVGDYIEIENSQGINGKVKVTAITENYVKSYAYMSTDTYYQTFNTQVEFKMLIANLINKDDLTDVVSKILESKHIIYTRTNASIKDNFSKSIKSINGVILVLILAAGLLCIVVEYNLTNVNICERKKELATMRVLGFHKTEVETYIFKETDLLSLFGSLVGLILGFYLHKFVVKTVEVNQIMFGRKIHFTSYLISIVIVIVFTILVNQVMRKNIRKIDMVDAMKASE